jgi:hypothetical protein
MASHERHDTKGNGNLLAARREKENKALNVYIRHLIHCCQHKL